MTNNTKNSAIVIAFASILLAWPLAGTNAFADGEGILSGTCGFDEPTSIDFGTISRGSVGTETLDSWAALGSETGNVDLTALDWFDLGDRGVGDLTDSGLTDITTTATVVFFDGTTTETFTATADGVGAFNFAWSGDAAADFLALADAIIADSVIVTAVKTSTTVTDLTSVARGSVLGNIDITVTGTTGITETDFTGGGATPVVHLQSEITKLAFTVDGTSPAEGVNGADYAGKTAIGVSGADTEIVALTSPNFPLRTAFQITGVDPALENLPFSGSLVQDLTFTVTCNVS